MDVSLTYDNKVHKGITIPDKKSNRLIKTAIGSLQGINRIVGRVPFQTFAFYALNKMTGQHYKSWNFNPYNYYEFGTGTGSSIKMFLKSLKSTCKSKGYNIEKFNIFLFDSFEGLPEQNCRTDLNPAWEKGEFSGSEDLIRNEISSICGSQSPKVYFIKGYYENSLTNELRDLLSKFPPSLINIDVDLYSSTKTVLDWVEPLLQNGTMFYFDDVFEYLGNPFMGELAAINEFNSNDPSNRLLHPFHSFGVSRVEGMVYTFAKNL